MRARCPSRSSRPRSRVHPVAASKSFNRFPSRTPPSSAYLEELHAVLDGLLFGRFRGHREELLDCHCARREHFRVQTHVLKHTLFNERIFKQMVYNCRRKNLQYQSFELLLCELTLHSHVWQNVSSLPSGTRPECRNHRDCKDGSSSPHCIDQLCLNSFNSPRFASSSL